MWIYIKRNPIFIALRFFYGTIIGPIGRLTVAMASSVPIGSSVSYFNKIAGTKLVYSGATKVISTMVIFFLIRRIFPILMRATVSLFALLTLTLIFSSFGSYLIKRFTGFFVPGHILFFGTLFIILFVSGYLFLKKREGSKLAKSHSIDEIDRLGNGDPKAGGFMFEERVALIFRELGYDAKTVSRLKREGLLSLKGFDQGADVIVEAEVNGNKTKTVVQCKLYKSKVGNSAIQEVVAAIKLFSADKGMVATNSYFTDAAIELARANGVYLLDRDGLIEIIDQIMAKKEQPSVKRKFFGVI